MAKSIYEVLDNLVTETSVPEIGKSIEHTLPRELFPSAAQFESDGMLLAWSNDLGITHAVLQKGIQKFLIDVRAAFKASKKDQDWNEEIGQKNVNEMKWEITKRPGQPSSKSVDKARYVDCLGMIGNLVAANMDIAKIRAMVVPIYGDDIVSTVFEVLQAAK